MISTSYRLSERVDLDVFSNFVRRLCRLTCLCWACPRCAIHERCKRRVYSITC